MAAIISTPLATRLLDEAVARTKAQEAGHLEAQPAGSVEGPLPAQSIVVALDGSEFARAALPPAEQMARCFHVSLVLVQAATPARNPYGGADPDEELGEADGYETLRAAATQARAQGLDVTEVLVKRPLADDPARAILRTAEAFHAKMIVMATHGRIGLSRVLHHSVIDEVIHGTDIPVLLVRPPQ